MRTWTSSPEWLGVIIASLGRLRSNRGDAARPEERDQAERLHRRAQVDDPVRVAEQVEEPAGGVDLDDVAAMDALLDAVADLPHEDGRHGPLRRPPSGRATRRRAAGRGHGPGGSPWQGRGTQDRGIPRRRRRARRLDASRTPPPIPTSARSRGTWPNLHVSQHPAVRHKLGILRDERTEPKKFREVVRELSWLLGYEALADARMQPLDVQTPIETMAGEELAERIGLIPILRAGLGMVDAMLELMPTAQVWHLGLFRDERTLRPVEYYNRLPDSATVDLCLILDPMLATGGSATAAIEVLKRWGAVRIKLVNLIAAPEGVEAVSRRIPTSRSTARRSTASSTRRATSCRASATPATASSGPATRADRPRLPRDQGRRPPTPPPGVGPSPRRRATVGTSSHPSATALADSAARDSMPRRSNTRRRWPSTVLVAIASAAPISSFERPSTTSRTISCSRVVSVGSVARGRARRRARRAPPPGWPPRARASARS